MVGKNPRADSTTPEPPSKRARVDSDGTIFTDLGMPMATHLAKSYTYVSKLPESQPTDTYVLGVDEAGRGPVLGPMVYAVCFCKESHYNELSSVGFADSKQLTEEKRTSLFAKLQTLQYSGWAIRCLAPAEISNSMLQTAKYNLNALAHDATIGLIQEVIARGIKVTKVFVDTVGPPASYQRKLQQVFPDIEITVAKKADALYPIVSAASICAKVPRDEHLARWVFEEGLEVPRNYGSGYPGDPNTVAWLKDNIDAVFGYPDIIRFSWATCTKLLADHAAPVAWLADMPANQLTFRQPRRSRFLQRPLQLSSTL
ncbi:hypothetical protein EC988_002214 [Linderina pennispora]|nr:hypothetical protein EC988_002214 [Linderina pennispora]